MKHPLHTDGINSTVWVYGRHGGTVAIALLPHYTESLPGFHVCGLCMFHGVLMGLPLGSPPQFKNMLRLIGLIKLLIGVHVAGV